LKRIAAITSVRNDTMFLSRWIAHYGAAFGPENLHVIVDGMDQPVPAPETGVNVIRVEYMPRSVVAGDKERARRASALAKELLQSVDLVIGTDADEFLVVDPALGVRLADYLSNLEVPGSLSALGLDVVRHLDKEEPIDRARPFLDQRRFAKISDRYTKALILSEPLDWGSGQHRVRGRNFRIDPNLYLLHFGSVDRAVSEARASDADRIKEGWAAHQMRRDALFDEVRQADPIPADTRFASARREMSLKRSPLKWNKPGRLRSGSVVVLPERFKGLV
jgi:hypothetical protein